MPTELMVSCAETDGSAASVELNFDKFVASKILGYNQGRMFSTVSYAY